MAKNTGTVYILSVASQHFSIAFVCLQGHSHKQSLWWLVLTSGLEARNSFGLRPVFGVPLSGIVQDIPGAAICPAYCQRFQVFQHG